MPVPMCSTTNTEAGRLAGRPAATTCRASTPPAEVPMTMMSCLGMRLHFYPLKPPMGTSGCSGSDRRSPPFLVREATQYASFQQSFDHMLLLVVPVSIPYTSDDQRCKQT